MIKIIIIYLMLFTSTLVTAKSLLQPVRPTTVMATGMAVSGARESTLPTHAARKVGLLPVIAATNVSPALL